LEAILAVVVPMSTRVRPAVHVSSSPYEISEDQKTDRPPDHEAQDHEGNPERLRYLVELFELRGDIHGEPHVNVTYIYMRHRPRVVKPEAKKKDFSGISAC
jgi:hypothetical protein